MVFDALDAAFNPVTFAVGIDFLLYISQLLLPCQTSSTFQTRGDHPLTLPAHKK
jgi:hypothetical protein